MAIWKDHTPKPSPAVEPSRLEPAPRTDVANVAAAARADTGKASESLIAADITIEGKIEGSGHVRLAGKFKGDVDVKGDLTIEVGARLTGSVRAQRVIIAGELEGNIEAASLVELQQSGALFGDLKAGSLTVAAGARMRGRAEFGEEDPTKVKTEQRIDRTVKTA